MGLPESMSLYLSNTFCSWYFQAMASELNMYESQVSEYKYEIERLARELQDVKKKYFMQKKKEQQTKYVHIFRMKFSSSIIKWHFHFLWRHFKKGLSLRIQDFPGAPTPKRAALTNYLAKCLPKTAWKWKKLDPAEEAHIPNAPLGFAILLHLT